MVIDWALVVRLFSYELVNGFSGLPASLVDLFYWLEGWFNFGFYLAGYGDIPTRLRPHV